MSDLISREAVLDRINKLIEVEKKQGTDDWGYGRERVNAYEAMLHMVESEYLYPSVEPEKRGDCVSRQTAIDALNNRAENVSLKTRIGLLDAVRVIDELPSVDPERKAGEVGVGSENRRVCMF